MPSETKILTQAVEYVEYAVKSLETISSIFERMGFKCLGMRNEPMRRSKLYKQGQIQFILTTSDHPSDPTYQFIQTHGDGVRVLGLRVSDVNWAHQHACSQGAKNALDPERLISSKGSVLHHCSIKVFGDVCNAFISYEKKGKLEDFFQESPPKYQEISKHHILQRIDHITINVEKGKLDYWAKFYEDLFGFNQIRYFDIKTKKTGLLSRAMRNQNGQVTMPFNEPTDEKSQIQEFIETLHGPGIQHIALATSGIIPCLKKLMANHFHFMSVPQTYYDEVPKRIPRVAEDLKELMHYGILVDGSEEGYLLQIFTEPVIGPFFFEIIQRKGDQGFGEGNFRALFESIERDQIRRGVLK